MSHIVSLLDILKCLFLILVDNMESKNNGKLSRENSRNGRNTPNLRDERAETKSPSLFLKKDSDRNNWSGSDDDDRRSVKSRSSLKKYFLIRKFKNKFTINNSFFKEEKLKVDIIQIQMTHRKVKVSHSKSPCRLLSYTMVFVYGLENSDIIEVRLQAPNKVETTFSEPKMLKKWNSHKIKGSFYLNDSSEHIISIMYTLDLTEDSKVFFEIEPYSLNLHKGMNYVKPTYRILILFYFPIDDSLLRTDMMLVIVQDGKVKTVCTLAEHKLDNVKSLILFLIIYQLNT
jgi:hypothetical protein